MPLTTTNAAILSAAKQAIEILLRFKGIDVELVPKNGTVIAKPGGGRDFVPAAPRKPQTIALSKLGNDDLGTASTDEGQYVRRAYALTGRFDMEIAIGDFWEDDEAEYTVETLDQTNGWKTSAEVIGFVKIVDPLGDKAKASKITETSMAPYGTVCCGEGVLIDGEWECCGKYIGVQRG